jgi:hypothetical protein
VETPLKYTVALVLMLALLAAPLAAGAQGVGKVSRIGILSGSSPTGPEASHVWGDSSLG